MSCCQFVSLQQLTLLVDRLRHASLSPEERAEHERFLQKCVPAAEALALIRAPENHPANPNPGSTPSPEALARLLIAMR